ncbi:MAG: hypothetical protein JKP95_02180 [Oceanicaulis sp.]|nr:hypothetical protein [Oceanicaulis sp.]
MARDALARVEPHSVELAGDTAFSEAQTAIHGVHRVVIRFPSFKDGRLLARRAAATLRI